MQAEEVAPWADEHSSRSSSSEVEVMAEPAVPRYEPLVMVDAQVQTDAGIRKALQAGLVVVHDANANTQLRLQLGCRTSSRSFPTKTTSRMCRSTPKKPKTVFQLCQSSLQLCHQDDAREKAGVVGAWHEPHDQVLELIFSGQADVGCDISA